MATKTILLLLTIVFALSFATKPEDVECDTCCSLKVLLENDATEVEIALSFAAKPKDVECDTCCSLVGAVEVWLASNATEVEIEKYLDKVCKILPYDDVCEILIETGVPELIEMLEEYETPQVVCTQLGMC